MADRATFVFIAESKNMWFVNTSIRHEKDNIDINILNYLNAYTEEETWTNIVFKSERVIGLDTVIKKDFAILLDEMGIKTYDYNTYYHVPKCKIKKDTVDIKRLIRNIEIMVEQCIELRMQGIQTVEEMYSNVSSKGEDASYEDEDSSPEDEDDDGYSDDTSSSDYEMFDDSGSEYEMFDD